jgi:hypothetical protein
MNCNPYFYKLVDWIDEKIVNIETLCNNPFGINIIKENIQQINTKEKWNILLLNINAKELLLDNMDKHIITMDEINEKFYFYDNYNPNLYGIYIDLDFFDNYRIFTPLHNKLYNFYIKDPYFYNDWNFISKNCNNIFFLENNIENINWKYLMFNSYAIQFIKKYLDKIINDYEIFLNLFYNEKIMDLLNDENCKNKLISMIDINCWSILCINPNAISFIKENIHICIYYELEFTMYFLSKNPNIFMIDYNKIKNTFQPLFEDLMKKCFHPQNICKYHNKYSYPYEDF